MNDPTFVRAQTDRYASIGRVTLGIAHDFNNLLTVISCSADNLLHGLELDSPLRADGERLLRASHHAAELVKKLLHVARNNLVSDAPAELHSTIQDLVDVYSRGVGENTHFKLSFLPHASFVRCGTTDLHQIVSNLIMNASDAMPRGGTIEISTKLWQPTPNKNLDPLSKYIVLSVRDCGEGIAEEMKKQIFETFFSTRGQNRVRGLGLSTVCEIVKRFNGEIEVESELGVGTIFHVYLPMSEGHCRAEMINRVARDYSTSCESILIVEDDELVRKITRRALEVAGYIVTEASCAQEALLKLERSDFPYDVLMADVGLPGMSGIELANKVAKSYPTLKILLLTGHAFVDQDFSEMRFPILSKPFTPSVLLRTVQSLAGVDSSNAV